MVTLSMERGGVETYLLALGRELKRLGNDVEIVTIQSRGPWFGRVSEAGIKALDLSDAGQRGITRRVRLAAALRKRRYDTVFFNHVRPIQRSIPYLPNQLIVVPVLHNDHEEVYSVASTYKEGWNACIGVSRHICDEATKQMPGKTAVYIPNGIEIQEGVKREPFSKPLQLVFVGRLHEGHKGVYLLPEILRGCEIRNLPVHLHIVGLGANEAGLIQRFAESKVEKAVTSHGALQNSEVRTLLRQCHCLLLPSHYEGMPIVVIEAQAEGCVPICTDLPGIRSEAVETGVNGLLVEPREAMGFLAAIETLMDEATWQRMSAAAMASCRTKFSAQTMGERYNQFIEAAARGDYPLNRNRALLAFVRNRPWKAKNGW